MQVHIDNLKQQLLNGSIDIPQACQRISSLLETICRETGVNQLYQSLPSLIVLLLGDHNEQYCLSFLFCY